MDHERIYDQIIDRARGRKLEGYGEWHHIVPKSLGGSDEKSNLVRLTAREHYICHWLLYLFTPYPGKSKMAFGWRRMCRNHAGLLVSARNYQRAKLAQQVEMRKRVVTPEQRESIRQKLKGRSPANKGVPLTAEQRKKISDKKKGNTHNRGRVHTAQAKENMKRGLNEYYKTHVPHNKGRKASPETIEKLRISHLGHKQTEETIQRRKNTMSTRKSNIVASQTSLDDIDRLLK